MHSLNAHQCKLTQACGTKPSPPSVRPWRAACANWRGVTASAAVDGPSTSSAAPTAQPPSQPSRRSRRNVAARSSSESSQHLTPSGKVGVVIVDHGSRKKASNEMLVEFGRLYGDLTGQEILEVAHMEITSPTIDDAVDRCAARGATTVVIAPYFLSRGRHIQEDIPALVRQAQARHPGLRCVIAEPIGIDPLMVQLISNRVAAALSERPEPSNGTAGAAAATAAAGAGGAAGHV